MPKHTTPPTSLSELVDRAIAKYPSAAKKRRAIENFAGSCPVMDWAATANLAADALAYKWSASVQAAIRWTVSNLHTIVYPATPAPAPEPARSELPPPPAEIPAPSKNPHRLTVDQTLVMHGYADLEDYINSGKGNDSVQPACCDEGCEVEPDGTCPHGCPAITQVMLTLYI